MKPRIGNKLPDAGQRDAGGLYSQKVKEAGAFAAEGRGNAKELIFGLKIKKNDGSTIYAEGTMEEMLEAIRKESKGIRSITMQRVG